MKESKDEHKKMEEKILQYIENKGSANLAELKKLGIRQTVFYNIRKLCKEHKIRAHIEVNKNIISNALTPKSLPVATGLKEEEIVYTIINGYEYPQDVKKLIDRMCNDDTNLADQYFREFVHFCEAKGVLREEARKLAHAIMADLVPGMKEKVAFELTYNDPKDIYGFKLKNWMTGEYERAKRYDYFVPK